MDTTDGNCIGKIQKSDNGNDNNNSENFTKSRDGSIDQLEARMPVSKTSDYYNMTHKKTGLMLVFNHEEFDPKTHHPPRKGTYVDGDKIKKSFRKIGFDVHVYKDLKLAEIKHCILEAVQMDHTNSDCIAVFVLTHGHKDCLSAYDEDYNPEEILWNPFSADKCFTLAGKPKLFFIQACQGTKLDSGIKLVDYGIQRTETDGVMCPYKIPVQADFLILYATSPGYFAFRSTEEGAFFVTALCAELDIRSFDRDLLHILTAVLRRVALDFESRTVVKERNEKRQIPYFQSSLTRLLQFKDKNSE